MDTERFLKEATHADESYDPDEMRTVVRNAETLTQAREGMRDYAWNQAVADRLLQEIVLEDDMVDRPDFAAHMPLIEPRDEENAKSPTYPDDLGPVGENRYIVCESPDTETVEIIQQEYEFFGLYDDGTTAAHWVDVDCLNVPEEDLSRLNVAVSRFVISGETHEQS